MVGLPLWMPSALLPLCAYVRSCFGSCNGISFMDSTSLKVCHNRRIQQHRVFKNLAARGKTSVDWFFGFKLHLVVNNQEPIPLTLKTRCKMWQEEGKHQNTLLGVPIEQRAFYTPSFVTLEKRKTRETC